MTTIGQLDIDVFRSQLTRTERDILDWINRRTPQRWAHALFSSKKIAAAVQCSIRTVGLAVKKFAALGLVSVVTGEQLSKLRRALGWRPSIRRALALGWRTPAALEMGSVSAPNERAKISPPTDPGFAPSPGLPPDPPIDASDDTEVRTEGGGGRDHLDDETPPPPSEVVSRPVRGTELRPCPYPARRKATPAELARLDRAAAKVTDDPAFPAWVRRLAKARGLRRVLPAVEVAAARVRDDLVDVKKPRAFVIGVLRTFDEDGVVPEIGEDPEEREERAWRKIFEGLKA